MKSQLRQSVTWFPAVWGADGGLHGERANKTIAQVVCPSKIRDCEFKALFGFPMSRPSKPSRRELLLRQENNGLRTTICCLRREIEDKGGAVGRLEVLLRERLQRVDTLTETIDRLRDQNRRLDVENDRLVAMMQLQP